MRKRDAKESLKVADSIDGEGRGRSRSGSRSSTGRTSSKGKNEDLPIELATCGDLRKALWKTVADFLGTRDDPWSLPVQTAQQVWDIALEEPHEFTGRDPMFKVVSHGVLDYVSFDIVSRCVNA